MASVAARLAQLKARRQAPPPLPSTDWRARPLRGHPVAVIDTETTGIDPATARIVEVAVVVIDRLGETEPRVALSTRVNPGEPIPSDATKVHGISDADVAECPTWDELVETVHAAVGVAMPCAYNAPYDHLVVETETERADHVARGWMAWGRWLDPFVLAKLCDKFEKGKRLADVAARRGIEVDAHGAAGDAMTTAMLLPILLGEAARLERRGRVAPERPSVRDLETVGAYLDWQRRAALDQERDLVEYLAKAGRKDPVSCPWHVLEGLEPPAPPKREVATARCKSCGTPIVWAVTSAARRIPLDPDEIRASEAGPGRAVSLVVDGGAVRSLREDPDGDIVGRAAHFATCPNAEPAPTPTDEPAGARPGSVISDAQELVDSFSRPEVERQTRGRQTVCNRCAAPVLRLTEVDARRTSTIEVDLQPVLAMWHPYRRDGPAPLARADGVPGDPWVFQAGAWWELMPSYTGQRADVIEVDSGLLRTLHLATHPDTPGAVAAWRVHTCTRRTG